MHKRIIAAALVAPIIALAPASAWAHHCSKGYHHHHARKNADTGSYGSSKSMNKSGRTGSQNQNMNQGTGSNPPSSTDQGSTSSGKSGGGI